MPKKSAGLLLYRESTGASGFEVLLVHPGGPFWRNKDDGAWTIPKGEFDDDEDPLEAAKREFKEETGAAPPKVRPDSSGETGGVAPHDNYVQLKPIKQANGKVVHAWAIKGDFDESTLRSNTFSCEWPPRSGRTQQFPEVDRAAWLTPEIAKQKILRGQAALIDELLTMINC